MTSIRVYIATTEGPVEVLSISREDPALRCVVCENGRAKALPISRDYDGFVKEPTGIIERICKHPAYRLDLSKPITNGLSWQLGTLLAHMLYAEERLALKNEPVQTALWLSGEVDRTLNVLPVDHIEEKLNASKPLLDQLKEENIQLHCFIPSGGFIPDDDFLELLGIDGEMVRLEMVRDVNRIVQFLSLEDPYHHFDEVDDDEEDDDPDEPIDLYKDQNKDKLVIRDNKALKLIALGVTLLALFGGIFLQYKDNIMALRENAFSIGINEIRAHTDDGCNNPESIRLSKQGEVFPSSQANQLCALEITLNNRGTALHMWAFAQRLSDNHLLLADRKSLLDTNLRKGVVGWRMIIPSNLQNSIDYRIVGLASDYPLKDSVERLIRQQIEEKDQDWDVFEKRLKEEKITVITALHTLIAP